MAFRHVCLYLSIPVFIGIVVQYVRKLRNPKIRTPSELNPQYDYVIVGGGTAGCVLAARLSEDPTISVLLLEAGGEEDALFYSHIPVAAPLMQRTSMDWDYFSVPQNHCCDEFVNKQMRLPSGKTLGGTSVLNYMHYVRGHPSDYDSWELSLLQSETSTTLKRPRWYYKDVEPYFTRLESLDIARLEYKHDSRGRSGPTIITEDLNLHTPLGTKLSKVLTSSGLPYLEDTGISKIGFGKFQFTIKDGKRISTASAYLRPAMSRSNLHVVVNAYVKKITFSFNDVEKKATGVEYTYDNNNHRVLANREVILTAGAYSSPHVLMLSGIGPKSELDNANIYVVHDNSAVGRNLQDHVGLGLRYVVSEKVGLETSELFSFTNLIKNLFRYLARGTGLLAFPPPLEILGNLKIDLNDDSVWKSAGDVPPNLQFSLLPVDVESFDRMLNITNMNLRHETTTPSHVFTLALMLLKPKSVGKICLEGSDSTRPPAIDPNYLSNSDDFKTLSTGFKLFHKTLISSPEFSSLNLKIDRSISPLCRDLLDDEDVIDCIVRNRIRTAYHPVGTCKMGPMNDGVVDASLRVHGVQGLRVVDASVIPEIVAGNICATVIMLAERAASFIKHDQTAQ